MFLNDKSEEAFERKPLIPLQTESVKSTMFNHTDISKHSSRSVSPVFVDLEAENPGQSGSMTSPVLVDLVIENTRNKTSSTNNTGHEMQTISNCTPEIENENEQKLENLSSDDKQAGNKADGSMEKATAINGTESVEGDYIAFTSPFIPYSSEEESDSWSDSWVSPANTMHNVTEDKDIKKDVNLTNGSDASNHSFTNMDDNSVPSLKSSTLSENKILGIVDTIGSPSYKRKNVNGPSTKRKRKKKNDIPPEPVPEPKLATSSYSPAAGRPLQLLITNKHYPDVMLTKDDMILLQRDVNLEILRLPEHEKLPLFNKVYLCRGGIHITCEDDYAKNWIANILPNLKCNRNKGLIIYRFKTVTAWIHSPTLKAKDLLTLIDRMNPGLNASVWKYYSCTKNEPTGYILMFGVDAQSLKELMRLKGKVRLGLGELKFRYGMGKSRESKE